MAPAVTLVETTSRFIRRGGSVSFRGAFTDPDAGDGPWKYKWVFGNGSTSATVAAPGDLLATRTYSQAALTASSSR
jgi:hypothetical protein